MGVVVRPDPARPGLFEVVAHAKGIIKNKSGRRKFRGFTERGADEAAALIKLFLLQGIDPAEGLKASRPGPGAPPPGMDHDGPTFEELAHQVLADWRGEDFKHRTFKGYESLIRTRLIPHFGKMPLGEIDAVALDAYFRDMRTAGRSHSTVRNHRSLLNCLFEEAAERGLIEANPMPPASRRGRGRAARRKKERPHWKSAQLAAGLEAARKLEPELLPLVALMGLAGLRLSEARGLRWEDLSFAARSITVRRTLSVDGVLEEVTKTGEVRQVDVGSALAGILEEHRLGEMEEGRGRPGDHIVQPPYKLIYRSWKRLLEASGLPTIDVMHLRHSFGFIHLRELRSPIQYVQRQMGHRSITVTVDTYGHAEIDSDLALADRMLEGERTAGGAPKRPVDAPKSAARPGIPAKAGS